jgi:hypothetical protein
MSRSYKHTPYAGQPKLKWAKRQANKLVRSKLKRWNIQDNVNPSWYKKVSESWNICDYYDITTWEEHKRFRKREFMWGYSLPYMEFLDNGDIDWENEYQLWKRWYIRK